MLPEGKKRGDFGLHRSSRVRSSILARCRRKLLAFARQLLNAPHRQGLVAPSMKWGSDQILRGNATNVDGPRSELPHAGKPPPAPCVKQV